MRSGRGFVAGDELSLKIENERRRDLGEQTMSARERRKECLQKVGGVVGWESQETSQAIFFACHPFNFLHV